MEAPEGKNIRQLVSGDLRCGKNIHQSPPGYHLAKVYIIEKGRS